MERMRLMRRGTDEKKNGDFSEMICERKIAQMYFTENLRNWLQLAELAGSHLALPDENDLHDRESLRWGGIVCCNHQ